MYRLLVPALVLLAAAPAAAAKPGTFAGTIGAKLPKGAVAEVRAIDRATGVVAATDEVARSGAFSLSAPAGSYTVIGTVAAPNGKLTTIRSAVSLKAGQRRRGADLTKKRARRKKARAAYVQERGQVTPGRTAVAIPDFTGDVTGELGAALKGINDFLITDVVQTGLDECDLAVIETDRIADVIKELEFQQSRYVDPSTRVQRNFIVADVKVLGTVMQTGPEQATVTVRAVDARTGAEVMAPRSTTIGGDGSFDRLERLGKDTARELCKVAQTYEIELDLTGIGDFATHSGRGEIHTKLTARRQPGKKGDPVTWIGQSTLGWTALAATSKMSGVQYIDPVTAPAPWSVTIRETAYRSGQIQVTWQLLGNDMATISADPLPDGENDPPPIPGQALVALLDAGPRSFTLPAGGGGQDIKGGITTGDGQLTSSGTMAVLRGTVSAPPP